MTEKQIKSRIVHKHDIEANWKLAVNFTPKQGEIIVYDVDENYSYERIKVGDGAQNINDLPFATDITGIEAVPANFVLCDYAKAHSAMMLTIVDQDNQEWREEADAIAAESEEHLNKMYSVDATPSTRGGAPTSNNVTYYKVSDVILSDEEVMKCTGEYCYGSIIPIIDILNVPMANCDSVVHFGDSTKFGISTNVDRFKNIIDYVIVVRTPGDSFVNTYAGPGKEYDQSIGGYPTVTYNDTVTFEETGVYLYKHSDIDGIGYCQSLRSTEALINQPFAYTVPEYIEKTRIFGEDIVERRFDIQWDGNIGSRYHVSDGNGGYIVKMSDFTISMEDAKKCIVGLTFADGTQLSNIGNYVYLNTSNNVSDKEIDTTLFGNNNNWGTNGNWVSCITNAPITIGNTTIEENGLYFTTKQNGDYVSRILCHIFPMTETVVHKIDQKFIPNADWSVNDPEGNGYIANRTHWTDEALDIKWDGNVDGRYSVAVDSSDMKFVKISDKILSDEVMEGSTITVHYKGGETDTAELSFVSAQSNNDVSAFGTDIDGGVVFIVRNTMSSPSGFGGVQPVFKEIGVYFVDFGTGDYISELRTQEVVHKIAAKYLPDNISVNTDITVNDYMTQPVGVSEDKKLFTLSPGGGEFRLITTVDTGDTTVDEIIISQDDNGNPLQLEEAYILVESCTKPYAYAPISINKQGVNWTPVGEDRVGKPACLYITKFQGLWACFCAVSGYQQSNPFALYPYQFANYRNYQLLKNAGNKIREIRLGYTSVKCTIYGRD